jgi:flagellar basal-body rod modification protein FlgD
MLTTQLKCQDPLSPMDSSQFTNQLVQFSSVEQQINTNSNLEQLIKLQTANNTSSAIPYLGQTVEVAGSSLPLQSGSAGYSYTLPSEATNCTIQIKDSNGNVVMSKSGETSLGRHEMAWDGTDSNGKQLDDGTYSVNVLATNADGTDVGATTTTYGQVTDITSDATKGTELSMSGITTTLDKVLSIKENASLQTAQYQAAQAQYQAAQAQYQAAQATLKASGTTGTTSTAATGQ